MQDTDDLHPSSRKNVRLKPTNKLLLSRADLRELGIWQSNSTLIRLEKDGRFPKRIRLSGACVCWDKTEVMDFIEARKAERASWCYADAR